VRRWGWRLGFRAIALSHFRLNPFTFACAVLGEGFQISRDSLRFHSTPRNQLVDFWTEHRSCDWLGMVLHDLHTLRCSLTPAEFRVSRAQQLVPVS
jgi:hypothetical protein